MVDPIADLAKIAYDHDLSSMLMRRLGHGDTLHEKLHPVDFALPGVTSIAVDPHKMGMSTIPQAACLRGTGHAADAQH